MSGFVLNIDQKLINQLTQADALVKQLGVTSERTRDQFNKAFSDMATIGVDGLIKRLTEAQRKIAELGGSMSTGNGLGSISAQAVKSADSVSILVQTITRLMQTTQKTGTDKIGNISNISTQASDSTKKLADMQAQLARVFSAGKQNVSNSAIAKLNEEIDASLRRLGELQKQLQYYTQGAGAKAAHSGLVDTSALQAESKMLMNKIQTLEHARNLERQAAQERLFAAQQEDAYNNKKITQEQAKREAERTSAAERSRHAREINQQYTNADNEQRQRTVKRWAEEEKAATKASQTVLAEILRQEERKERAHQAELRRKERERKETEKNERTRIRKPNELINMQGTAMNLQQLLNYANELKKTLYTLNPNTKEFTKLNNIYAQTKKQIHDIKNELGEVNNKQNSLLNGASKLGQAFGAMFSISAIKNFVTKLVQTRGEYEQQHKAMQVLLQDYNKANKVWNKTVQLAVRSPYTIQQLTSYTKQLAAYRIESDKLYDTTKRLADVSVGLGVDMQRIILAYGQVRAANFLRGTELRQFTEAGIPMLDELAKYFSAVEHTTVTAAQVFDRISKRQVLFTDVDAVIQKMTDAGGIFYNMQEEMANTLKGMSSNLKDKVFLMFNEIGTETQGLLSGIIKLLGWFTENWRVLAGVLDMLLLPIIFKMGAGFIRTIKYLKLMSVTTLRANGGFLKLASTWKGLSALMLTNPIGLVITLVLSLGAAVFGLHKRTKAMNEELDKMRANTQKQITNLEEQKQKVEENNRIIKDSENATNLTEEAETKLAEARAENTRILDELKKRHPDFYKNIIQQKNGTVELTGAIEEQNKQLARQAVFANLVKGSWVSQSLIKNSELFTKRVAEVQRNLDESIAEYEAERANIQEKQVKKKITDDYAEQEISRINAEITNLNAIKERLNNLNAETMTSLEVLSRPSVGSRRSYSEQQYYAILGVAQNAYANLEDVKKIMAQDLREMSAGGVSQEDMAKYIHDSLSPLIADTDLLSLIESELNNYFLEVKAIDVPLNFNFNIPPEEIDQWQKNYNKAITEAISEINKDLEDSDKVYFKEITVGTSVANTRDKLIKDAQEAYSQQTDLLKRVRKKAEENNGSLIGTAYEGYSIKQIEANIELQKRILDFFEAPYTKKKNKENEILSKRISLLKEMHNKYKELSKEYSKEDAITKVLEAFEKTFEEAFRGTNIDLSIYDFIAVDAENEGQQTMTEFFKGASEATKSNPYIRTFSTNLLNRVKKEEGLVLSAYDDVTSRILKKGDKVKGTITIGYGTTQYTNGMKIQIGDTITAARAEELLTESLQKRAEALNKVLDANKDLIVTQQQYDVLLDLSYQGGVGQVKWLIERAKNEEKGVQYINRIYEKVKQTMGETIASRFGTDFVTKFREAQSIVERMGMLLQTMNLTTVASGGKVDPRLYRNMQARSDRRAADFTTDLKTITEIEKVLKKVVNLDITTPEGIIYAFEKLRPIAEKEGQEAINILNKTISGFKAEVGLSIKQNERETIEQQVDSLFAQFDLSRELEKLGLSKDLMKSLFNVEYLDLDSLKSQVIEKFAGTSTELQTELKKDVSTIDWAKMDKLIGEERAKEAKQSIEKITDMEAKAAKERVKTYVKYLMEAQREAVKIKVEELRKLKEIEESNAFSPEQKEEIKNRIRKETNADLQKQEWADFQNSEMYTMMFEDLEHYGSQALETLREKLIALKGSLTDLPASEVKEIINQLSKIEDITIERNPFRALKETRKQIKAEGITEEQAQTNLAQSENEISKLQSELDIINIVNTAKSKGLAIDKETQYAYDDIVTEMADMGVTESDIVATKEKELKLEKQNAQTARQQAKNYADRDKERIAALNKTKNILGSIQDATKASMELMDSLGVSSDSVAYSLAEGVDGMISLTLSAIEFGIQMETLGYQSNMALGIIGWIAIGIQAVAKVLSTIFKMHDAGLQKQIDKLAEQTEDLQEKFDALNETIDNAYNTDQLRTAAAEGKQYTEQMISNYEKMKQLEEDKKKTDEDAVKEYEDNIKEQREALRELEQQIVSEATAGIFDNVADAASGFVDAWYEAFKETGDGLKGLEDNFDEMFLNLAKQQATMQIAGNFAKQWEKDLSKYINETDTELTKAEAQKWAEEVKATFPALNDALEGFLGVITDGVGATGELSGLEKGIAGASEETVQVLSAYANSCRFLLSNINTTLSDFATKVFDTEGNSNPILAHLHTIAEQTSAMRKLLDSVQYNGGQGVGIRVYMP